MKAILLCAAAFSVISTATPSVADDFQAHADRIDALSDDQLLSVFTTWVEDSAVDCVTFIDSANHDAAEDAMESMMFDLAVVPRNARPALETHLVKRLEILNVPEFAAGYFEDVQVGDEGTTFVLKDCVAPSS